MCIKFSKKLLYQKATLEDTENVFLRHRERWQMIHNYLLYQKNNNYIFV